MADSEELHLEKHVDYIKSLDKVGFEFLRTLVAWGGVWFLG